MEIFRNVQGRKPPEEGQTLLEGGVVLATTGAPGEVILHLSFLIPLDSPIQQL
jgi:hypothetical protein